jgi:hypothetical protein
MGRQIPIKIIRGASQKEGDLHEEIQSREI